jgi:hypothetical protein
MLPDDLTILNDDRGMRSLLEQLGPASPAMKAGAALMAASERLLVCTGFPVGAASETDGPAGAVVLAGALRTLGKDVAIVSWPEALDAWGPLLGDLPRIDVPRGRRLDRLHGVGVTIEVCGRTGDGTYRNMHGVDVGAAAPWFEDAIAGNALVSIGDGGNELGMGAAPKEWFSRRGVSRPASSCDVLVVGQVSNWAALAVVASLGRTRGRDLLPGADDYARLIAGLAGRGVVDGVTGTASASEDGFDLDVSRDVIASLQAWAKRAGGDQ